MDRLNLKLRDTLQERARLAADIARWKASRGISTPDPRRERDMLRQVLEVAPAGFDRTVLRQIFVTILRASRRHAMQAARPWQGRERKS
jgi:3-deoxy-7-phosphoheptulonate synthase/chorismate mutase